MSNFFTGKSAHVRRRFYDLHGAHKSAVAKEALERIAALYAIEEEIRGRSAEERREIRNARSRPLRESLKQWLVAVKAARPTDILPVTVHLPFFGSYSSALASDV